MQRNVFLFALKYEKNVGILDSKLRILSSIFLFAFSKKKILSCNSEVVPNA